MLRKTALPLIIYFLLITLPYLAAAYSAGPDHRFGGFLLNVYDGNSYLAKMFQGWRGDWRFVLPYTAEPGKGAYLFGFYIFLGHLSNWTGLSTIIIYHSARLLGAGLLAWTLYKLVDRARLGPDGSRWVLTLALLGSGLGWMAVPFGIVASDFLIAEAYPFLSAFATPHFSLGLALLVWVLLEATGGKGSANIWRVGLLSMLLALLSPFGAVIALAVTGGLLAWEVYDRWKARRSRNEAQAAGTSKVEVVPAAVYPMIGLIAGGGPVLFYYLWVVRTDPILSGWDSQNLTAAPGIGDFILSLAPAILLAAAGGYHSVKKNKVHLRLFLVWAALGALLVYLPLGLQRRFMMGLYIPLAILAGLGILSFEARRRKTAKILGAAALLLSLPTNLLILFAAFHGMRTHDSSIYLTANEAEAFAWIEANTAPDALILSAPETGLFIPAYTGRRVIYGHPFETVDAEIEEALSRGFFADDIEMDRWAFLADRGVDFIFFGPREQKIGQLPFSTGIQAVFQSGDVAIFQVLWTATSKDRALPTAARRLEP